MLAKLTEKQVKKILSSTLNGEILGKKYGVTRQAIFRIRRGHSWKIVKRTVI